MYTAYWSLDQAPFRHTLDPRRFYEGPGHEEALARLFFLIEEQRRCGVVSGPAGVGRSLLLRVLEKQIQRTQRKAIYLDVVGLDGHELLWRLASALQLAPDENDSALRLWSLLHDCFTGLSFARTPLVLLCDHLESAHFGCLHSLRRLLHIDISGRSPLTVIVAARDPQPAKLHDALAELSDLRIELPPLDADGCRDYVRTLLNWAGCERPLFERAALERLTELSGGIPREINRLGDLALLAAMSEEREMVSPEILDAVAGELQLAPSPLPEESGRRF